MLDRSQNFDPRQNMRSQTFEIFHYRHDLLQPVSVHHHDFYEIYCQRMATLCQMRRRMGITRRACPYFCGVLGFCFMVHSFPKTDLLIQCRIRSASQRLWDRMRPK